MVIGYGLLLGILYLAKVLSFPYFEVVLILSLMLTIKPWRTSSLLFLASAIPITVINHYNGMSTLTYIQILVCYLSILTFNQKHKAKILFIAGIVLEVLFGFMLLPAVFKAIKPNLQIYYYLFPLLMFLLRSLVQFNYWLVGYSEGLFLQIPLFLTGLEYGTILTLEPGQIEFWYLILFFTLQVINERTHFSLGLLLRIIKSCHPQVRTSPTPDPIKRNNHILAAHSNGYSSIHSFHLICCIYLFTCLPLSVSPYPSSFSLSVYCQDLSKPIIIWALVSVYEIMSLVL